MRTRFDCGGTAPEPADMTKNANGLYQPEKIAVRRAVRELDSSLNFMVPGRFVLFHYALGGSDGRNNDHRHGSQQSGKKEVLENRQNIFDQEIHDWFIVFLSKGRNQKNVLAKPIRVASVCS